MSTLPFRSGVNVTLEEVADELLRQSLVGVTSHEAKRDVLTPWKKRDRRRREVFNSTGVADPSIRKGMYHRSANPDYPELNSRDGVAQARTTRRRGAQ